MKLLLAVAAASILAGASSPATADRSATHVVRVAVYRGPAACADCPEAMARAIERLSGRYRVDFVGPHERRDVSAATLKRYAVYVQPGGGQDMDGALAQLGPARVAAIRRFVDAGGGYLGLCMGAYLAGASSIGLIGDDPDGEVRRPGFPVRTVADAVVPVRWAGHARSLYFQDGPYLPAAHADPRFRAIAAYNNGDLAAARYGHGRGTVVLSGPHPEADRSWYDDADLPAATMPTDAPVRDLLDQFDR